MHSRNVCVTLVVGLRYPVIALAIACAWIVIVATGPAFAAPIKVACIGEHTTHSDLYPPTNREAQPAGMQEYPAMLQTLLGAQYQVRNFGDCCASVLQNYTPAETHPYVLGALAGRGPGYTESLAFLPDIVVIGSWGRHDWGMNKLPGEVWDLATFQKDYDDLVTRYMKLSSHPKIYVSLPVPILFGQGTVPDNGVTTSSVLPAIKAVAAKYNLPIIDLYTAFLGRKDLFRMPPTDGEGEHVADGPGLQHIADTVYAALMGNSDGGSQEASADSDSSTVSGSDAAVSPDAAMPTSGSSSGAASNDDAGTPAGPGADASALQGGGNPQGGASGSSAGPPPPQGSSGCSVPTTHSDRKGAPLPFLAAAAMLVGIARRRRPAVRE